MRNVVLYPPMHDRVALTLVGAKTFQSGTVLLSYVPQSAP